MKPFVTICAFVITVALTTSVGFCAGGAPVNMQLTLRETNAGRETRIEPSLTVEQGKPATLQVVSGETTYSFEVTVSRENGRLIASTRAKVIRGDSVLVVPHIPSEVGRRASVSVGSFELVIDSQSANARN